MAGTFDKILGDGFEKLGRRFAKPVAEKSSLAADQAIERQTAETLANTLGRDTLKTSDAALEMLAKRGGKKAEQQLTDEEIQKLVTPIVLRQPHDPAYLPKAIEKREMVSAMKKNLQRELEALKTLSPKDRTNYHGLMKLMPSRPDGQLGLQNLLLDGKLTMGSAKTPTRSLIEALHDMGQRKLDPAIDRETLLAQMHQELADPVAVSQMHKGTCAATSNGQILFGLRNPTDYTDFVADLASPEGKATMPNGDVVKRAADWASGNDRIPSGDFTPGTAEPAGRSIPSQLTEPTFMQYAKGGKKEYSNTFDEVMSKSHPGTKLEDGGLTQEESARLLEAIFPGEKYSSIYADSSWTKESYQWAPKSFWNGERGSMKKEDMLNYLAGSASVDSPVPASVNYQLDGGHAILVTGSSMREVNRKGDLVKPGEKVAAVKPFIDYINPWGRYETQPAEGFGIVLNGIIPNGSVPGVKR